MSLAELAALLGCVSVVTCGMERNLRNLPVISNSLVNLGHIDISLNVHPGPHDFKRKSQLESSLIQSLFSKPNSEMSCPCSSHINSRNSFSNPKNLFSKILSSNSFFEFDQDLMTSSMCCSSNEHGHEDTFILELSPKMSATPKNKKSNVMTFPKLVFDTILPKPRDLAFKPRATDLFFFPKNTKNLNRGNIKKISNTDIKVVGDKKLNKNLKTYKYQILEESKLKKDLKPQEKGNKDEEITKIPKEKDTTTSTAANAGTIKV